MTKYKLSTQSSILLLGCLYFYSVSSLAHDGRLTLRGLTGSTTYADVDGLLPLYRGCDSLLYADVQAKYNQSDAWFAGLGLGFRELQNNYIFGSNVFIDRAESKHNHNYWIVSPGIEAIMPCWDVRLNGYIPVDKKRRESSFFPSGLNECGIHGDCSFVEFSGHQQFEHRFLRFEEVGEGADLIAGINLPCCGCMSLHGGVYYYHLEDADDIKGVGARLDVPINSAWAITGEASYDNEEHSAVAIGLRFQLGHTPRWGSCPTLCDRLYDPVYRYIGPIEQAGLPVVRHQKDEGLFLRRDNIFFFSEDGTAILGDPTAGTFENPFADDQFTDATIAAVGSNVNFYFSTGDYVIDGGLPDNRVTLLPGQSIFGRTENFRCTAVGEERPILEGGIDIIDSSHTLDSIVLENIQGGPAIVIALSVTNGDVHLCNDVIHAETTVGGDNAGINAAIGIVANISTVTIDNSIVEAIARVGGDNLGANAASAIGNFDGGFVNNIFLIHNSLLRANARVGGTNSGINLSATIGNNADAVATPAEFTGNIFSISDSILISLAEVIGDNTDTINFASVIGNNVTGIANFIGNIFAITDSSLSSIAEVFGDNTVGINFATVIGNNAGDALADFSDNAFVVDCSSLSSRAVVHGINSAQNAATNIGINAFASTANFVDNAFSIIDSTLTSVAEVDGDNTNTNSAISVGNNAFVVSNADFLRNIFAISGSSLNTLAQVRGDNTFFNNANNIGNSASGATANFTDNIFAINDSSLNTLAQVRGDNTGTGFNFATAIGNSSAGAAIVNFANNTFSISCSSLSSVAEILGDNTGSNFAKDIGNNMSVVDAVFINNNFDIDCTFMEAQAMVEGDNTGTNLAMGVDQNGADSQMDIFDSVIDVLALVEGANTGTNRAVGLSALGVDSIIRIFDSLVNVAAFADAEINEAIPTVGNVVASNTIFNVSEVP